MFDCVRCKLDNPQGSNGRAVQPIFDELYMRNDLCQALAFEDAEVLINASNRDLEAVSDDFESERGEEEIRNMAKEPWWSPSNPEGGSESLLHLIKKYPLGQPYTHTSPISKGVILHCIAPHAITLDGSFFGFVCKHLRLP